MFVDGNLQKAKRWMGGCTERLMHPTDTNDPCRSALADFDPLAKLPAHRAGSCRFRGGVRVLGLVATSNGGFHQHQAPTFMNTQQFGGVFMKPSDQRIDGPDGRVSTR